jgi:hypothetical protein
MFLAVNKFHYLTPSRHSEHRPMNAASEAARRLGARLPCGSSVFRLACPTRFNNFWEAVILHHSFLRGVSAEGATQRCPCVTAG